MKHILLITDSYPPEIRSASHLMLELAEELTKRGNQVTVATCWPQYNLDAGSQKIYSEDKIENNIRVIRLKHLPHHKVNFIVRGISQLILPSLFIRKIKKLIKTKIDSVIVYSPPLPLSYVGAWVKKVYNAKFILNIQDIFPQNAIDLGVLKNKFIIKIFYAMEKYMYQKADIITVHSEGNKNLVLKHYPDIKNKLTVLHNWVDINTHQKLSHKNYREIFNLDNKFVCVFAGVIGPSQYLTVLIQAAAALNHISDLCFLIVGDGTEKEKLQKMACDLGLNNIIFKDFISREDYPDLLNACDVGLVSLSPKNKTPVVPGKILGYMAAGLPVVAFLNQESDGHEIISKSGCGYSVVSDNLNNIISVISKVYDNKNQCKALGESGFNYVKNNFSKEACVDEIEQFL